MQVDGEIIGVGNVVVDITERKEAEVFRQVVMDNMAEGLYTLDADGLVTYVNPAACRMLGWSEQELLRQADARDHPLPRRRPPSDSGRNMPAARGPHAGPDPAQL